MSDPFFVAGNVRVNEYDPFAWTVTGPVGWATPYSSITLKAALLIPLKLSVALPEIVTVTGCGLFGAVDGLAAAVTTGATVSILIASECVASVLPRLSTLQYSTVCWPCAEMPKAPA